MRRLADRDVAAGGSGTVNGDGADDGSRSMKMESSLILSPPFFSQTEIC